MKPTAFGKNGKNVKVFLPANFRLFFFFFKFKKFNLSFKL